MSQTIDQVYSDFNVQGVPASGEKKPSKAEIRALLKMIQNSGGQAVTRNTLSALNGVTPPNENYMGIVLTGAEAGYYSRSGGAWVFGRGFPDSVAVWTQTGGSGSAYQVAIGIGIDPSSVALAVFTPDDTNSAGATVNVSGVVRPILSATGAPIAAGELLAGRAAMLVNAADGWRVVSSQSRMTFRGAWASGTSYDRDDLAENGGSIWLALRPSTGVTPTEGADWTLFLPGVSVGDGSITEPKYATGSVSERALGDEAVTRAKQSALLRASDESAPPLHDFNSPEASGLRIRLETPVAVADRVSQGLTFVPQTGEWYYILGAGTDWVDRTNTIVRANASGVVIDYSEDTLLTLGHGQDLNHLYYGGVLTFLCQNTDGDGMTAFTYTNGVAQALGNVRQYVLSDAGTYRHTTIGLSADKRYVVCGYRKQSDGKFYARVFSVNQLLAGATGDRRSDMLFEICMSDSPDYDASAANNQHMQAMSMDGHYIYSLNGYFDTATPKYLNLFRLSDGMLSHKVEITAGKSYAASVGTGTTYEPEGLEWVSGAAGTNPVLFMGMRTGGGPGNVNWAQPLLDTLGAFTVNGDRNPLGISLFFSGGAHDIVKRAGTALQFSDLTAGSVPTVVGALTSGNMLGMTAGFRGGVSSGPELVPFNTSTWTFNRFATRDVLKSRLAVTGASYTVPSDGTESGCVYHVLPATPGTNVAFNLPQDAVQGHEFHIACGGTGVTTLTALGGATINGGATKALTVNQLYTVVCTRNNGGSAAQWMTRA